MNNFVDKSADDKSYLHFWTEVIRLYLIYMLAS